MKIVCPCGSGSLEASFIGSTTKSDEYESRTKYAWFDDRCGHYIFLLIRAPFASHGRRGGDHEITHTASASDVDRETA